MPSRKCSHCNNQTLDPSGYCHLHQGGVSQPASAHLLPSTPLAAIPAEWQAAYDHSQAESVSIAEVRQLLGLEDLRLSQTRHQASFDLSLLNMMVMYEE